MYNAFTIQLRRAILPLLALALCAAATPAPASPVKALRAAWAGNDFVITLSDSAAFAVNDEEGDTSRLVLDIPGVSLDPAAISAAAIPGANSRTATLRARPDGAQLVIVSTGQLGWAVLWRPYSHQIVVHTFSHAHVSYAEEQYYLGLLALELDDSTQADAEDLLGKAYATGENRAGSVLGAYYARNGDDSLALKYLSAPMSADDYGALAEVQRRMGDTAAAAKSGKKFQELMGQLNTAPAPDAVTKDGDAAPNTGQAEPSRSGSFMDRFRHSLSDWRVVAALCLVGVALLLGIGWMMMRRSAARTRRQLEARRAATGATQGSRPEPNVTRVSPVETRAPVENVRVIKPDKPAALPDDTVAATPAPSPVPVQETPPVVIPAAPEPPAPAPAPATTVAEPAAPAPQATQPEPAQSLKEETPPPAPAPAVPEPRPASVRHQGVAQRIPAQAAELRRRLEAMREAEAGQAAADPQAAPDPDAAPEPLLDTARRMNASRDHIELRKKLTDMLRDKKADDE